MEISKENNFFFSLTAVVGGGGDVGVISFKKMTRVGFSLYRKELFLHLKA